MTSSNLLLDGRRRTYVRLIGEVRHALNQALAEEFKANGLTKAAMATKLQKSKSFVTRKMNGTSNMTLESLADLAFALNRPVTISLPSRKTAVSSNEQTHGYKSQPPATASSPKLSPFAVTPL